MLEEKIANLGDGEDPSISIYGQIPWLCNPPDVLQPQSILMLRMDQKLKSKIPLSSSCTRALFAVASECSASDRCTHSACFSSPQSCHNQRFHFLTRTMSTSVGNERLFSQILYDFASCPACSIDNGLKLRVRTTVFTPPQTLPPSLFQLLRLLHCSSPPSSPSSSVFLVSKRKTEVQNKTRGHGHQALSIVLAGCKSRQCHAARPRRGLCFSTFSYSSYFKEARIVAHPLTPLILLRYKPCGARQGRESQRHIYNKPKRSSNLTPPSLTLPLPTDPPRLLCRSFPTGLLSSRCGWDCSNHEFTLI